ncbi:MAG: hypothetical protein KDC98_25290 [Planctomycetes bacterium]|nr:hypothetical protein [Planctomycetota bacterium]
MRLDPVYVLAPKKTPRPASTRRMFLLTGGAFVAGAAVGGACGYSMGVAASQPQEAPRQPEENATPEYEKSGNHELDELRRLAVKAPLDELFDKSVMFLTMQMSDYKTDPVLWYGVDRMSKEIIDNPDRKVDYMVIAVVIENIKFLEPPEKLGLRTMIPKLKLRRDEEKQRK